jgi:hypothetical protein
MQVKAVDLGVGYRQKRSGNSGKRSYNTVVYAGMVCRKMRGNEEAGGRGTDENNIQKNPPNL